MASCQSGPTSRACTQRSSTTLSTYVGAEVRRGSRSTPGSGSAHPRARLKHGQLSLPRSHVTIAQPIMLHSMTQGRSSALAERHCLTAPVQAARAVYRGVAWEHALCA